MISVEHHREGMDVPVDRERDRADAGDAGRAPLLGAAGDPAQPRLHGRAAAVAAMLVCAQCGRENAGEARFCSGCGSPLAGLPQAREERKVVTVLFADLVGFTSRAEQLDPEDVRAMLSPYYAQLREELERYGGTVEKFIGDAVMAVFGAPAAHEDDPERAVRAALAIRDGDRRGRAAPGAHRGHDRRGARHRSTRAPSEGEGMVAGRRRQHGRPTAGGRAGERHPGRREHAARDAQRDRLPRGRAGRGEGQDGAGPRVGGASRRARASASTSRRQGAPLVGRQPRARLPHRRARREPGRSARRSS